MSKADQKPNPEALVFDVDYTGLLGGIRELLEASRRASARAVNAIMTATYWEVGRRIVEFEQGGAKRAEYGEEFLAKLAVDLTKQLGRGFSRRNLQSVRQFYQALPASEIWRTLSAKSTETIRSTLSSISGTPKCQTPSGKSSASLFSPADLARSFPLPWSQYVPQVSRSRQPRTIR